VTATVRYLLAEFARSRRFVAPLVALAVVVAGLYASGPNPVLTTAGAVAAYAFPVQTWLVLAFLNTSSAGQRHVLAAGAGTRASALARLLAAGAVAAATALLALAYPVVAGRFERAPSAAELAVCLVAGLAGAVTATALAALFAQPVVRSRAVAVLGAGGCALATVPLHLPPVSTAEALDTARVSGVPPGIGIEVAGVALFATAAALWCTARWQRR
jgi:hypothetical protein